jgi:phenylacetic acid degradation operon negative regulatory protein
MKDGDLLIGIMASFSPRLFTARELIELARPFPVTSVSVRTSLSRLKKKGVIALQRTDERKSAYGFTAKGSTITSNVAASFARPDWKGWDGMFWGIAFSLPAAAKNDRYRLTKKLSLFRFAPLYPGFWIRPCREREKMDEKLRSVFSHSRCTAVRFRPWRPLSRGTIGTMWNIQAVFAALNAGVTLARAARRRITSMAPAMAFVERYVIGEQLIAALFRDPLLPRAFLPAGWPADTLRGLFKKFDAAAYRLSRPFWKTILVQGGTSEHH